MNRPAVETEPDAGTESDADFESDAESELAVRVARLSEENERLRAEYARARRSEHRRTALALALVGGVAVLGGLLLPDARTVLFALGGTGLFAGALTFYLSPERFLAASVGEAVYDAAAANATDAVAELGLSDTHVYLPTADADAADVRLFVPQQSSFELPARDNRSSLFVTDGDRSRGVALRPTGAALFDEFERALVGDLVAEPAALADQLSEALVEQFELATTVTTEFDSTDGRLSVGIDGSVYDPVDRIDHPIPSFFGVGLARSLDRPVTVDVHSSDDRVAYVVTCTWSTDE